MAARSTAPPRPWSLHATKGWGNAQRLWQEARLQLVAHRRQGIFILGPAAGEFYGMGAIIAHPSPGFCAEVSSPGVVIVRGDCLSRVQGRPGGGSAAPGKGVRRRGGREVKPDRLDAGFVRSMYPLHFLACAVLQSQGASSGQEPVRADRASGRFVGGFQQRCCRLKTGVMRKPVVVEEWPRLPGTHWTAGAQRRSNGRRPIQSLKQ